MSVTLLLNKLRFNRLSGAKKDLTRQLSPFVNLSPRIFNSVQYKDPTKEQWYLFDDDRFTLEDAAIIGTYMSHIDSLPDDIVMTSEELADYIEAHMIPPSEIVMEDGADPYTEVLEANGCLPKDVKMFSGGMPIGYTPMTYEEIIASDAGEPI